MKWNYISFLFAPKVRQWSCKSWMMCPLPMMVSKKYFSANKLIFRLPIAISIWVSLILGKHIILCHGSLNISWALAKYKNPIKSGGRGFSSHKVPSSFLLYWASVRWQHIPLRSRELSPDFKSSNFRLSIPRRPRFLLHRQSQRRTSQKIGIYAKKRKVPLTSTHSVSHVFLVCLKWYAAVLLKRKMLLSGKDVNSD